MQALLDQVPLELRNGDLPGCWWPRQAWEMWQQVEGMTMRSSMRLAPSSETSS
jgi:hypothetical protein